MRSPPLLSFFACEDCLCHGNLSSPVYFRVSYFQEQVVMDEHLPIRDSAPAFAKGRRACFLSALSCLG
jgi:hypothetical protein